MKASLATVQKETWDLCVSHFQTLAMECVASVVRELPNDDAHGVAVATSIVHRMAQEFRGARRSCIADKPREERVHGRDYGGAA